MSAFVRWFEDYSVTYVDDTTWIEVDARNALNVSPFGLGQFVIRTRAWNVSSGTGNLKVQFETSVDGEYWRRHSGFAALTPSNPDGQVIISDMDTTDEPLSRYVRPVFIGNDGTSGSASVLVTILALLKHG